MEYGYEKFIERLIELAGIQQPKDWKPYESWSPYRLQDLETDQPGNHISAGFYHFGAKTEFYII